MLYKIYVGLNGTPFRITDHARDTVHALTARHFQGATFYDAIGVWAGEFERSVVVEILTESSIDVHRLAKELKVALTQNAILITKQSIESELI